MPATYGYVRSAAPESPSYRGAIRKPNASSC